MKIFKIAIVLIFILLIAIFATSKELWKVQASIESTASVQAVWKLWTDVSSWPSWDNELEWSTLQGPFVSGAEGSLKPKGWSATKFTLVDVQENKQFSTISSLPFTIMRFDHTVHPIDATHVLITHKATITGLLAPILYFSMRKTLERGLSNAVIQLAALAEASQ